MDQAPSSGDVRPAPHLQVADAIAREPRFGIFLISEGRLYEQAILAGRGQFAPTPLFLAQRRFNPRDFSAGVLRPADDGEDRPGRFPAAGFHKPAGTLGKGKQARGEQDRGRCQWCEHPAPARGGAPGLIAEALDLQVDEENRLSEELCRNSVSGADVWSCDLSPNEILPAFHRKLTLPLISSLIRGGGIEGVRQRSNVKWQPILPIHQPKVLGNACSMLTGFSPELQMETEVFNVRV